MMSKDRTVVRHRRLNLLFWPDSLPQSRDFLSYLLLNIKIGLGEASLHFLLLLFLGAGGRSSNRRVLIEVNLGCSVTRRGLGAWRIISFKQCLWRKLKTQWVEETVVKLQTKDVESSLLA